MDRLVTAMEEKSQSANVFIHNYWASFNGNIEILFQNVQVQVEH